MTTLAFGVPETFLKIFRTFLDGKPARDLRHWRKQRKRAVCFLQRFIGDRFDLSGKERIHLFLIGCQM